MYRLLAVIFFSATLSIVGGIPARNLRSRDDCNVEQATHCCQGTSTTNDAEALQVLHDLGFPVDPNGVVVGNNCTDHDDSNSCVASSVCCSGNLNSDTALDCTPVNENPRV